MQHRYVLALWYVMAALWLCLATAGAVMAGEFTVTWQAPTERADGTPLTEGDIAKYKIYYVTPAGQWLDVVISDPSLRSWKVLDVPDGTYTVKMTAFDTGGRESGVSNEVIKEVVTVVAPPKPPVLLTVE